MSTDSIAGITEVPVLTTIGDIHRRTGIPMHKLQYAIKTRKIPHIALAGKAKIFSDDGADLIVKTVAEAEACKFDLRLPP